MIDVRQLTTLLAIRDAGSLTAAAAELRVSVPTVAHHLDALEAVLQATLVQRSKRGSALTPIGEAVASDAERLVNELQRTEQMVADLRDAGLSRLRIGTFPSIGSRLLPAAIRDLHELHRVRVEVVEGEPAQLIAQVQAGDIHAALVYDLASDPALDSAELNATPLLEEDFVVMLSSSSPLAERELLDFSDLESVSWVVSHDDDEASNRVLRRACRAAGYELRPLVHTDDLNMIHGFVSTGLGLALMTASALDLNYAVTTRQAVQPLGSRRTSFVTRRGRTAPVIRQLGSLLEAQVFAETAATGALRR